MMDRFRVLELALQELNRQRAGINEEIAALRQELNSAPQTRTLLSSVRKRGRKRTTAERKAHSLAMKQYWAARKAHAKKPAAGSTPITPASAKVKTKDEARSKAISAAMKKAWAKRRATAAKTSK
jgi:hypothetical protein